MSKNTTKFVLFVGGLAVLIPLGLIAFALLSSFIAAFNVGADPASIFRGHQLILPQPDQARWIATEPQGTQPSPIELEELLSAYWLAWEALVQARRTGDHSDLPTYWAGAALEEARAAAADSADLTHTGHRLRLLFFSDDSSVAAIRDEAFTYSMGLDGETYTVRVTVEAVLTLDNGFWRIRQHTVNFH